MAFPLALIPSLFGAGTSLVQMLGANSGRKKAEKEMNAALNAAPVYQPSQYAKNALAETLTSKNAINPALIMTYQQMQQGAANQTANAQRNATSGAEALNVGSAAQNDLQASIPKLAMMQTQYNQQNKDRYLGALENMANEDKFKHQSDVQRNSDRVNMAMGKFGANNAMFGQGVSSLASILANPSLYSGLAGGDPGDNDPQAKYASSYMTNTPQSQNRFAPQNWWEMVGQKNLARNYPYAGMLGR